MATSTETKILERLDQIVKLLALQIASDKSVTDGARSLKLAGLDNKTIAEVLNTSDAVVRTLTTKLRKKK